MFSCSNRNSHVLNTAATTWLYICRRGFIKLDFIFFLLQCDCTWRLCVCILYWHCKQNDRILFWSLRKALSKYIDISHLVELLEQEFMFVWPAGFLVCLVSTKGMFANSMKKEVVVSLFLNKVKWLYVRNIYYLHTLLLEYFTGTFLYLCVCLK